LIDAYKEGSLTEVFGTGTAATISLIKELRYKDFTMQFDPEKFKAASELKVHLSAIREGRATDKYGWMMPV